jgi:phosphatidylglycerophosphatase C
MPRLAIYDMDRTITVRGTYAAFLAYAVPRIAPARLFFLPLLALTSFGYALRLLTRKRLKELNLRIMLGERIDDAHYAPVLAGYAARVMDHNLHAAAIAQIAADRADGYRIVLATASFAFYVYAIADQLGVDRDDVVATQLQRASGTDQLQCRISGENCYGAHKLESVKAWMAHRKILREASYIRFYSDHVSDASCLSWADEAIATTPHAPLRHMAQQRGWQIVEY